MADDNGIVQAVEKNTKTLSTSLAGVTSALNNAGIVAKETNISQEEHIKNEKRVEAGKKAWETRRAALEDARARETAEHQKRVEGGRQAWQTRQENEQKKQGGFFQKLLGSQLTPAQQKEKSKDEQSWMKNMLGKPLSSMRDTIEKSWLGRTVGGKAKAGLKGLTIGQAQISEKHANFFVNVGDAKAEEMLALIKKAKSTVKDKFDIEMNLEVKLMGFEEREIESL